MKLDDTDMMALKFLSSGPDVMGPITTDHELAAAMTFIELERHGYVSGKSDNGTVTWTLTDIGIEALL